VGFGRRNFMVPIPDVASFDELNAHLLAACLDDDERCVDRQSMSIGEAWQMEKPYLLPLPEKDFACCIIDSVTLNGFGQVEFETNRYSVPAEDAYHNLVLKAYPFRIDILYMNDVIASHPRCYGKKQDILDPLHYLPLLEQRPGAFDHAKPIRHWRESWPPAYEQLLARLREQWPDGRGVREFVRILRLHEEYPADRIVQAVELALAYGCAHLDGVKLCLRQLIDPEPLRPPLDLSAWPALVEVGSQTPDLQCYDRLLERV
jgi:hypothetical protein